MRTLASIVRIGETYPIEASDRLSVAIPEGEAWHPCSFQAVSNAYLLKQK